jgi:hypothetical protein
MNKIAIPSAPVSDADFAGNTSIQNCPGSNARLRRRWTTISKKDIKGE